MGRKPSNSFVETTLAFQKGTEFRLYDVKLPFSCKVIFETTDPKVIKTQGEQVVFLSPTDKDRISKLFQEKGYRVIKIEPHTMQVPELCPTCKNRGVPKIDKKSTKDTRTRKWRNKDKVQLKSRSDEYWLVFVHNSKQKCRITRFFPYPFPSWKKQKSSIFPYTKFMFPYNYEWIKHQLEQ